MIKKFQKKYPEFIYQKYHFSQKDDLLNISFDFFIKPNIRFTPQVLIKNINLSQIKSLDKEILSNFVFHLGLIEMFSYWKATCSPLIKVNAGSLDKEQMKWWKELLIKGMGQFFYTNKIDFTNPDFINIISIKTKRLHRYDRKVALERLLVPIGGGKDSIVSLELLKKAKKKAICFSLNPTLAVKKIFQMTDVEPITVERTIDKKLLELNKKGFFNGHTPFSSYLAFLSSFCALLFNCGQIVASQERSSNEANIKYLNYEINHQYSKSFEFESNFRSYLGKYLAANLNYFSFLRPLYEAQISKIFSQYKKYFSIFKSCNMGQQSSGWCGQCSKCLFIFLSLYPFVKEQDMHRIFGENLLEKDEMVSIASRLCGINGCKPFECVGTIKENFVLLYLSLKKKEKEKRDLPIVLQFFKEKILPTRPMIARQTEEIMKGWDKSHYLADDFQQILKKIIKQ